jgi:F0F1-type ATP synthase assembly protein I
MKPERPKTAAVVSRSMIIASGIAWQVGCVTILIVGAALAGGLWLDQQLNTKPLLTIILLLVSVPFSLLLVMRIALSAARQIEEIQREESKKE